MKIEIAQLPISDYLDLKESMLDSFTHWGVYWRNHQIQNLPDIFPVVQLCIAAAMVIEKYYFVDT